MGEMVAGQTINQAVKSLKKGEKKIIITSFGTAELQVVLVLLLL
jgi:hypothetical protein